MQSFAEQINEVEMAAVITFTKLSWGNGSKSDSEFVDAPPKRDSLSK